MMWYTYVDDASKIYKTCFFSPFSLFHHRLWQLTSIIATQWEEQVKMAALIRQRIRAVVFNQSGQWQGLCCSRGDCDDDRCWRRKHWIYTCSQICSLWSRACSTTARLCWEQHYGKTCGRQKGEKMLKLQKNRAVMESLFTKTNNQQWWLLEWARCQWIYIK